MLELQSLRSAVCHAVEKNCQWISHSWGAPPLHHDFCPFQIQYEQNSGIITSGVAQRYYVNIASEITIPLRRSTQPIGAAPCEKGGQGGSELSGSTAAFGNPQICFGCSLVIPMGPGNVLQILEIPCWSCWEGQLQYGFSAPMIYPSSSGYWPGDWFDVFPSVSWPAVHPEEVGEEWQVVEQHRKGPPPKSRSSRSFDPKSLLVELLSTAAMTIDWYLAKVPITHVPVPFRRSATDPTRVVRRFVDCLLCVFAWLYVHSVATYYIYIYIYLFISMC